MSLNHIIRHMCTVKAIVLSLLLMGLMLLGACGQKGDLYLPPEKNQQQD